MNFEKDIASPFLVYLDQIDISEGTTNDKYLKFLEFLVKNDQNYELFNQSQDRDLLESSLDKLWLIEFESDYINYDELFELIENQIATDVFIAEFKNVLNVCKEENYLLSPGLIASGFLLVIKDHPPTKQVHFDLLVLCISALAITNGI